MREELTIRPARPHEREALEALQRRASLMWDSDREALLANPDAIFLPMDQIEEGHVFVCERDGAVVGFGVVLPRVNGQAVLDGLFVEPAAWRSGVGARLVRHAEYLARQADAAHLHVVANPNALAFYAACGFQRVGEELTRFGVGVTMRKALTTGPSEGAAPTG